MLPAQPIHTMEYCLPMALKLVAKPPMLRETAIGFLRTSMDIGSRFETTITRGFMRAHHTTNWRFIVQELVKGRGTLNVWLHLRYRLELLHVRRGLLSSRRLICCASVPPTLYCSALRKP